MLHGISHPARLAIAYSLAQQELDTWQIVNAIKLPPALVAHHLKLMHTSGWVKRVRVGKRVTYSLLPKNVKEIKRLFADSQFVKSSF